MIKNKIPLDPLQWIAERIQCKKLNLTNTKYQKTSLATRNPVSIQFEELSNRTSRASSPRTHFEPSARKSPVQGQIWRSRKRAGNLDLGPHEGTKIWTWAHTRPRSWVHTRSRSHVYKSIAPPPPSKSLQGNQSMSNRGGNPEIHKVFASFCSKIHYVLMAFRQNWWTLHQIFQKTGGWRSGSPNCVTRPWTRSTSTGGSKSSTYTNRKPRTNPTLPLQNAESCGSPTLPLQNAESCGSP